MRSVTLKSTGTTWVLAPGAEASFANNDVLVIRDVPDNITDVAAMHVANQTAINTPTRAKELVTVAFDRLGAGKLVNLVMGRPVGSTKAAEERKRPRSVSLTDEQAATFSDLGGSAWLQEQLNAHIKRTH